MKKVMVVMYHYVRDLKNSHFPEIKGLDYSLFKKQIEFFSKNYCVITMEELIDSYDRDIELPNNALLLTFDDGYIDHYTFVLPILLEYGMQGSFFIPGKTFSESVLLDVNKIHFILASQKKETLLQDLLDQLDFYRGDEYQLPSNKELFDQYAIENRFDGKEIVFIKRILQTAVPEDLRHTISSNLFQKYMGRGMETRFAKELYLNYDQIKCMKRNGMYIGVHGYDHYWLGNLPGDKMKQDIDLALSCLDEVLDKNSWVMNYPYGSFNQGVMDYLSQTGCKLGFTTEVRCADVGQDNRYQIPRLDTNDFPPKSDNYKNFEHNTV